QVPALCSAGCRFYGNPGMNGVCSVCNKEHLQIVVQNSEGRISPPVPSVTSLSESLPAQSTDGSVPEAQSVLDSTSLSITSMDKAILEREDLQTSVSETAYKTKSLEKPKQKKNLCFMCRKKVGLTGFECQRGNVYCGVHRYSDVHNCS
ncbi:hypothetical protein K5549_020524, partial [Capra hircus]